MNVFEFMSDSPWLTFFLVVLIVSSIRSMVCRACRMNNINRHGWSPPHCDADGDFPSAPVDEEEES